MLCVYICVQCVQMVAKGKDCADLFPAVVKNVVSKNSGVCMYRLLSLVIYLCLCSSHLSLSLLPLPLSLSFFPRSLLFPSSYFPCILHCLSMCALVLLSILIVSVNIESLWLNQVTTLFETISLPHLKPSQYSIVYRE